MLRLSSCLLTLALFGLAIGLPIGAYLQPATADEQYCCCETDCHALGACDKSYRWTEIDECANDVFCARSCLDVGSSACGSRP